MKIKELKEKLEANTSEKLFGIDEQPEQNCPKVDKGIKAWYSVQRDIEGYCKERRCDTVEEAEKIGGDIDWAIGSLDVVEEYEELRKQCEKIRAWGQGWKDLAKKLIEQQKDVSNLLADEFYVKLETETETKRKMKTAEEMDFLTTVYFQLQYEISNRSAIYNYR
jgi:hypothetical protein